MFHKWLMAVPDNITKNNLRKGFDKLKGYLVNDKIVTTEEQNTSVLLFCYICYYNLLIFLHWT